MYSAVYSAAVYGIDSKLIRVEADVTDGLPGFDMVGFLSTQVKEAQNRVRTALRNSGFYLKPKKITVNLSPADLKKTGTGFDLPIAVAVLAAYQIVPSQSLNRTLIVGELSLSGTIRCVPGVLAMTADARKNGCDRCIVPSANENEARIIPDIQVVAVDSLEELISYLQGKGVPKCRISSDQKEEEVLQPQEDFSEIYGQEMMKRAAMTAAAGFHNLLMLGPPGTGKSMIARRIPGILPTMSLGERIELSKVYSVLGMLPQNEELLSSRPFRAPHHTTTAIGLSGGGLIPRPGEISLAHNGILFLDEFPEFSRDAIEVLRQPLETGRIHLLRNGYEYVFPADIMLVAAMNPCPCGYYPDMTRCRCSYSSIKKYLNKISYPILDRIDLCVEVPEVRYDDLHQMKGEHLCSREMKQKVELARLIQAERFCDTGIRFNSEIAGSDVETYCKIRDQDRHILKAAYEEMKLSIRGLHKLLRISRTIADLNQSEEIKEEHLAEAFAYRAVKNQYW